MNLKRVKLMNTLIKKKPGEKCEGCGYEPQGDLYHNVYMDLYVCEGCLEVIKDKHTEDGQY